MTRCSVLCCALYYRSFSNKWASCVSTVKSDGLQDIGLENWLSGRKQRVVVEGEESSWRPVTSGVPQGSVLGPILFLLYIDFENLIGSNILKFADDTKIFRKVESSEDRHKVPVYRPKSTTSSPEVSCRPTRSGSCAQASSRPRSSPPSAAPGHAPQRAPGRSRGRGRC